MIEIVQLDPSEWIEYKAFRLKALQKEPLAFGKSYEEAAGVGDEYWKERLIDGQTNQKNFYLFAKEGNQLIGMIGVHSQDLIRCAHVAEMVGMYVDDAFRGKGVGRMLVETLIEKLKQRGIEKVKLLVHTVQLPAIAFYESMGFHIDAKEEKELKVDGKYYDHYIMSKFI